MGESSGTLFSYHFERTQVGVVYFSVIMRSLFDYQKHDVGQRESHEGRSHARSTREKQPAL